MKKEWLNKEERIRGKDSSGKTETSSKSRKIRRRERKIEKATKRKGRKTLNS